ncbi:MAG: cation transporter [Clostridia bacterium]|nr:cation transporter [Clostridia bacterium]
MTELLCKLFIKKDASQENRRKSMGTMAGIVGVVMNIFLFAFKLLAGIVSGSVAIVADALNNLSDAGAQIISIISFKLSSKPADREHPFGHARIEYVASLAVSFLIILIGFELFKSSAEKIFNPGQTTFEIVSVIILAVSVLVKLWLCLFNRKIADKINSSVMKATAADSLSDAAATFAVLVSMLVLRFFKLDIDAYMGIIVSVLIFVAGIKVLNEAKNFIIGSAPDEETVNAIKETVLAHEEAIGIHDLMVHSYGASTTIASLHVEVDGSADVFKTHDAIDNIEKELFHTLGIQCTIHMDPIVTDDETVSSMRLMVSELVKEINGDWNIHDFRMVVGETHTNLIFDAVVPYECNLKPTEISAVINTKIKEKLGDNYFVVLTIDKD